MTISSRALFHLTGSLKNLENILRNGFSPRYCPEYLFAQHDQENAINGISPLCATPMICFCDLSIAQIGTHISNYGNYGVGLRKPWGQNFGLSPVLYAHQYSRSIWWLKTQKARINGRPLTNGKRSQLREAEFSRAFIKPIMGPAWRTNKVKANINFYEEREWRYVPMILPDTPFILNREEYKDVPNLEAHTERIKIGNILYITPESIEYLFVKCEKDIPPLVELLRELYKEPEVTIVTTSIMTMDAVHDICGAIPQTD